jgi:hypothetical protein
MGLEICCPDHPYYTAQRKPTTRKRCMCRLVWTFAQLVRQRSRYVLKFRTRRSK